MNNLDRFMRVYRAELAKAAVKEPDQCPDLETAATCEELSQALVGHGHIEDCEAIRATCKILCIAHTYRDIYKYVWA